MKYLLPLAILFTVSVSCKKKETHHTSEYVSKGDFLMIVVSDSVEYARECKSYDLTDLHKSPVYGTSEFENGLYRNTIYAYGIGISGTYYLDLNGFWGAVEFPNFIEYYSNTLLDSIPGNELDRNEVYSVPLDTSEIDQVMLPYYPEEMENGWDKIKDLRIVYEYRKNYPDSKIGFVCLKKLNGEMKRYFFMNKYKP